MKKSTIKKITLSLAATTLTFSMMGSPVAEAKRSKSYSSKSSYSSSKKSYKSSRGSYSTNSNSSSSSNYNNSSNQSGSTPSSTTNSTNTGSNTNTYKNQTSNNSNNYDTSWKDKISSISKSELKYPSPYSGSSYKPSGNYDYSKYSGKAYYKSGSGFATTLLTAAGTYFVLSHFFGPDPVYVNAETGEEIDIDDYDFEEIQSVEVEADLDTQVGEEGSRILPSEEWTNDESVEALVPEESEEEKVEVSDVTVPADEQTSSITTGETTLEATNQPTLEKTEENSPITNFFSGLLGAGVFVGIYLFVKNRRKR